MRTSPAGRIRLELFTDCDHVVQAQVARFELERIDVDLNLAVGAAIGLRHRRSLHVGDLVAHLELRQILEPGFVQALALERDQADGLRGSGHAQHNGRQRARRQAAQIGHGEVGNVAQRRIGIGAGFEVDLDQAHAGERARLAVIHIGGQRKEALEGVGDVGFDLLRRHAVIERSHHHHRHIDVGKQVHRHAHHGHRSNQRHHQAQHEDEKGKTQGKLWH